MLGDETKVQSLAQKLDLDISNIELINPATSELTKLVQSFVERRKGKATEEKYIPLTRELLHKCLFMLVKAHGLVSGAAHSTGDTVRPALDHQKRNQVYQEHQVSSL